MGLKMASIHSASVQGTASQDAARTPSVSTQSLFDLMKERDDVEEELKALGGVLASHGVDMSTPLLTPDGFPRSDIDVAQIRITRARMICLRNDYKTLTNKMEVGLHAHHAAMQANPETVSAAANRAPSSSSTSNGTTSGGPQTQASGHSALEPPFARVNALSAGSPADAAGLKPLDEIRRFGMADWTNHERLTHVARIVQSSEGKEIAVKVKRKASNGQISELDLTLVPRSNWGGRGTLGCHLVPL